MSEVSYNIKFIAIELVSKSIVEPPFIVGGKEPFNFNFWVDLRLAPEQKTAAAITTANIVWAKENKEVANFKILCAFELPDFDTIFTKVNETKYNTPIELEIILKSVGMSTIRGVIASEVRGTYLQGAVMPLIDMNTLVREQREKEAEQPVE